MTLEQHIEEELRSQPDGLTLDQLEEALARSTRDAGPGVVECVLRLSGRCQNRRDRWVRTSASKLETVMNAITKYAEDSERAVFKAEAALRELAPEEKPTREELASAVGRMKGFSLLKNDMIKVERQT